jgi:NADPH:quinone reductase-like Zn-dependent oxidoreductase
LCVPEKKGVVHKPANVTFEQAAVVPVAGMTALQALRDDGRDVPFIPGINKPDLLVLQELPAAAR